MTQLVSVVLVAATIWVAYLAARGWSIRYRALRRIADDDGRPVAEEGSLPERWLTHWLELAGYRRTGVAALFVTTTAIALGVGVAVGQLYRFALVSTLVEMVANVPGGAGEALAMILTAGPWILFVICGLVPTMVVRAARRERVRAIEQDLPLVLELFATMGEAGLGFDSALAKIVRAQDGRRPLVSELVGFQHDMLAGVPRSQALRRMARRIEVGPLTSFTSALIQAEQVGASMAETVRHQAEDLRQRRRENALLEAQALPVKLVFPLVICFLPGIFLSTLAPVLYQMIQVANGVLGAGAR